MLSVILLLLLFVTFIKDPGQGWGVGVGKQSKLRVALAAQLKSQSFLLLPLLPELRYFIFSSPGT